MTILDRLVDELHRAKGPVSASTLSQRLGVDRSALDGMLGTLVARGALVGDGGSGEVVACGGGECGMTCDGLARCPFIVAAPQTLSFPRA